jgi:hypothetical protein
LTVTIPIALAADTSQLLNYQRRNNTAMDTLPPPLAMGGSVIIFFLQSNGLS